MTIRWRAAKGQNLTLCQWRRCSSSSVAAGENGGGIELSDDRLEVSEAAGERMHRRDVAKTGHRQIRRAEIEHRVDFSKPARRGGEIGKGGWDQVSQQAEGRAEDYRKIQV